MNMLEAYNGENTQLVPQSLSPTSQLYSLVPNTTMQAIQQQPMQKFQLQNFQHQQTIAMPQTGPIGISTAGPARTRTPQPSGQQQDPQMVGAIAAGYTQMYPQQRY